MVKFPFIIRPFRVVTPVGVMNKGEVYRALRKVLAEAEAAGDQEVLVMATVFWGEMRYTVEIQQDDWDWLREQSGRFDTVWMAVVAASSPGVVEPVGHLGRTASGLDDHTVGVQSGIDDDHVHVVIEKPAEPAPVHGVEP